jgi:hypothetical protein
MSRVVYWGSANIGRNLVLAPPGGMLQGVLSPMPTVGGATIPMTFTLDDPCGCAERLDVAEMEKIGGARNDNAVRGIDPAMLSNVTNATPLSLHCGRFRFDSIGGAAAIQLTITGRTAIFVDGNVALSDAFQLVIAPGADAELDWFIRGSLSIGARAQIGDPQRPSATRIYVGGPENDAGPDNTDIVLSSAQIGANIYAPNTNVNITAIGMAGSVYAKNLSILGVASVRYDRAILNKGNKCEQPIICDKCHTCNGGAACIGGTCQPCMTDDECCEPLVCVQRSCQPLLFP